MEDEAATITEPEPFDLSPRAAGQLIGVHRSTVIAEAKAGHLAAWRTTGGHWRFRRSDVLALVEPGTDGAA